MHSAHRRKDGTVFWEETTITPVFDPAGNLANFMAVKEDVTARKALEQAESDQRRLAEALRDAAAALNSTLKLEEVLDRILDSIGKIAVCDAVFMVMLEGDAARLVRHRGMSLPQAAGAGGQAHYRLADFPLLGPLLETRLPCIIADTADNPTCAPGCRMSGDALLPGHPSGDPGEGGGRNYSDQHHAGPFLPRLARRGCAPLPIRRRSPSRMPGSFSRRTIFR